MNEHPPTAPTLDLTSWQRPYSFGNAFEAGWRAFAANYGVLLLVVIVYALIYFAVFFITSMVDSQLMGSPNPRIQPLSIIANWLFLGPLSIGLTYVGASAVRQERPRIEGLFTPFRRYTTIIVVTLLTSLIGLAIGLVAALPVLLSGPNGPSPVGLLVYIPVMIVAVIAAIYIGVRLWFAGLVAVDPLGPQPSAVDALKLSWDMTRGQVSLSIFLLGIVCGLILVATLAMLVLPAIFFGGPLVVAVGGAAYALRAAETGVAPASQA